MLMLLSDTMPSPPRDQSCMMIDLALMVLLGQRRRLARPVVDGVPHDVDVALDERRQLRRRILESTNFTSRPYFVL